MGPRLFLVLLIASLIVVGFAARPASAQAAPLVVEADEVTFDDVTRRVEARGNVRLRYRGVRLAAEFVEVDLQREVLTARGRVVLIDARGRELRGEALTYDVRLELAEMTSAETLIDRVYVRGTRVQAAPAQVRVSDAMLTTCDPANPAVRVTARALEITPGERLVARQASLWLGSYRVVTLPVLVISLRSAEETARSLPRVGYNHVDGFWLEYTQGYPLGSLDGLLTLKYGTRSGFSARNALTYHRSPYLASLAVGRNQTADLVIFDQAELLLARAAQRLGALPVFLSGYVSGGRFRETDRAVETSRLLYSVTVSTATLSLGPATTWDTQAAWEDAFYGTGARQGVLRVDSTIQHQLDERSTLRLTYRLVEVVGGTPFLFDAVSTRPHDVTLQYTRRQTAEGRASFVSAGLVYDFRGTAVAVTGGYARRVEGRYHWGLGARYNLTTGETAVSTNSGISLGHGTYFTVDATYNTTLQRFEEGEARITSRICNCLDVSLRYRWAYQNVDVQQLWLEIGLSAIPETRLQFQYARP